jgi:hypothetical protein
VSGIGHAKAPVGYKRGKSVRNNRKISGISGKGLDPPPFSDLRLPAFIVALI